MKPELSSNKQLFPSGQREGVCMGNLAVMRGVSGNRKTPICGIVGPQRCSFMAHFS